MQYDIHHITRFTYDNPVRESVTELRMQPRTEGFQRCLKFDLSIDPDASADHYVDHLSNIVHHFDIPVFHSEMTLRTKAVVEMYGVRKWSEELPAISWKDLDLAHDGIHWDYLHPSRFARPTAIIKEMADKFKLGRHQDPVTTLKRFNEVISNEFQYAPQTTHVESTIDEAIKAGKGVCQDFTHIMITLGRMVGIPCRYVSGYLYHRTEDHNRSAEDATHAWVEAWLPGAGWIGFDPTNNLIAEDRHIRVAIGRDYADVPPTRGTFRGHAREKLSVGVRVTLAKTKTTVEDIPLNAMARVSTSDPNLLSYAAQQSAQQQQQ